MDSHVTEAILQTIVTLALPDATPEKVAEIIQDMADAHATAESYEQAVQEGLAREETLKLRIMDLEKRLTNGVK